MITNIPLTLLQQYIEEGSMQNPNLVRFGIILELAQVIELGLGLKARNVVLRKLTEWSTQLKPDKTAANLLVATTTYQLAYSQRELDSLLRGQGYEIREKLWVGQDQS